MSITEPVARKDHRCDLCALRISKGSRYRHYRLTPWDHPDNDGLFTHRAHLRCDQEWERSGEWELPEPGWMFVVDILDRRCPQGCGVGIERDTADSAWRCPDCAVLVYDPTAEAGKP